MLIPAAGDGARFMPRSCRSRLGRGAVVTLYAFSKLLPTALKPISINDTSRERGGGRRGVRRYLIVVSIVTVRISDMIWIPGSGALDRTLVPVRTGEGPF